MFPKVIYLTCKDKNNITNQIHNKCCERFKELYKDYEIMICDDKDIYEMMGEDYPEHIEKIKQIKIGAVLADIFRYYILYKKGGIYADMDCYAVKHINSLFERVDYRGDEKNIVVVKKYQKNTNESDYKNSEVLLETNEMIVYKCLGNKYINNDINTILSVEFKQYLCQWFMISKPEQEIFRITLERCFENLNKLINLNKRSKNYTTDVLKLSGPYLFLEVYNSLENKDTIKVLPQCCFGSHLNYTDKEERYVKHLFTGTWRKNYKDSNTVFRGNKNTVSYNKTRYGKRAVLNFRM